METRAVVYKALFGPRFRVCRDCFGSLPDRRSIERYECAGTTAVSWVCELLYSQSRVGVSGSQLFIAAGNAETGWECRVAGNAESDFYNLISIAFITARQSCIKELGLVGGSRPNRCRRLSFYLDGFSLMLGFGSRCHWWRGGKYTTLCV